MYNNPMQEYLFISSHCI